MKIYQDSRFIRSGQYVICITDVVVDFGIIDTQCEFTVRGKARCADGDKFDESIGKRLAETRASKKVYSRVNKMYNSLIKRMENDFNIVKSDAERVKLLYDKESKHLTELESKF